MRLLYTRADFDSQNSEKPNTLIMAENDENKPKPSEQEAQPKQYQPIETFRELIVGNEQRQTEGQVMGMKELFTSMLVENRKEYDRQLSEMKNLFVGVLEENRKIFQEQLQSLYEKLPTLIQENIQYSQQEEFLYISNEERAYQQTERLSRLSAVKELIGGANFREVELKLQDTAQSIEQKYALQKKVILEMSETVSKKILQLEEDFNEKLRNAAEQLSQAMIQQDAQKTQKITASALLKEIAHKFMA